MRPVVAVLVACLLAFTFAADAKNVKTTRNGIKPSTEAAKLSTTTKSDVVTLDYVHPDSIEIRGFDKPLYSIKETFLVTNHYSRRLTSMTITIDYVDIADRTFNSRTLTVACNIPPHSTRQLAIRSFDVQKSYYYIRSRRPRAQSTPFDIHITVDAVTVK